MRLVVDWDGTVTVRDSLVQVIHEFGDPALLRQLEPRVGVDLTLHEEIALEFLAITAPLAEVAAWVVEHVEVRDGLHELAELEPLVISAGFHELIEPVLEREGVRLEVLDWGGQGPPLVFLSGLQDVAHDRVVDLFRRDAGAFAAYLVQQVISASDLSIPVALPDRSPGRSSSWRVPCPGIPPWWTRALTWPTRMHCRPPTTL